MFDFVFFQGIIDVINHGSHQTKCSNAQQIPMQFNAVFTYNIVRIYLRGWIHLFAIFNYMKDIRMEKNDTNVLTKYATYYYLVF